MYQPYPVPNFGQSYQQPYQQPYQAPSQQLTSQPPAMMQRVGIMGRVIGSHEEIAPNEVPMDGSTAFFPVNDGSVIYAKAWNRDGSISTLRYAPVVDNTDADSAVNMPTLLDVMDTLDDIQSMLKESKPATTKKTNTRKAAQDDAS